MGVRNGDRKAHARGTCCTCLSAWRLATRSAPPARHCALRSHSSHVFPLSNNISLCFKKSRPISHQPHRRCEQAGARAEPGEEEGIQGPVDGGRGTFRTRARAPPRARPRARRVETVRAGTVDGGGGKAAVCGGCVAFSRAACGHSMLMHASSWVGMEGVGGSRAAAAVVTSSGAGRLGGAVALSKGKWGGSVGARSPYMSRGEG